MTKEEAKTRLIAMKAKFEMLLSMRGIEMSDVFDVAIKALEQEPDAIHNEREQAYMKGYEDASKRYREEPCEDTVSRQAVMDFIRDLRRWYVRSEDGKFTNVGLLYDDVMFGLDRLPSVTPQPKTGHWIEKDGYDGDTYYDCSVCGESWTTIDGDPWDNGMNYCPHCGVKMEEGE